MSEDEEGKVINLQAVRDAKRPTYALLVVRDSEKGREMIDGIVWTANGCEASAGHQAVGLGVPPNGCAGWALSPAQARRVAALLLAAATQIERADGR